MLDLHKIFFPDTPLLEIFIRGTCVYWALLLLLRFGSKREAGSVGLADMLVIVVIADAAQNAMSGTYNSIASGLFLVATILAWDHFIDWICFRVPAVDKILTPQRVCLIRNGQMLRRNMRKEFISTEELMEALRLQGAQHVDQVKHAMMESSGKISVVKYEDKK